MRFFPYRVPAVAALPLLVVISACTQQVAQTPGSQSSAVTPGSLPPIASAQTPAERGKILVTVGGCNDCHTTKKMGPNGPEPDMSRMLSGHPEDIKITAPYTPGEASPYLLGVSGTLTAWSGPWGVSFAANLTPDQNTGTGAGGPWTEELFVKALKTGKHLGTSRDILPPMPWNWYSQLSEDDLKAIWAYLRTIPAISNHVPDPIPPAGAPAAK